MKNKNRKRRRTLQHLKSERITLTKSALGFASSESFVSAVTKIYFQEIKDIDRFVKFAELHSAKHK